MRPGEPSSEAVPPVAPRLEARFWASHRRTCGAALGSVLLVAVLLLSVFDGLQPSAIAGSPSPVTPASASRGPAPSPQPSATPDRSVALGNPTGQDSASAAQLGEAEASLGQGAGPAGGVPFSCSAQSSPGSVNCQSTRGATLASLPASDGAPNTDLQWEPLEVPKSREYIDYAMTWDSADGYVLLFGGSNAYGVYGGDTWIYQTGAWTQLHPLTAPEGRDSSGLAYDWWDNAVVLFGGYTPGTGGFLNDTWLFKAGVWTQLTISGPSPRYGFSLVYDPNATYNAQYHSSTPADVLFGGTSYQCVGGANGISHVCNETWYFWADKWQNMTSARSPPPRWGASMVYDPLTSHLILFGGYGGSSCLSTGYCGDTWEYNWSAGWVQVPTPVDCGNAATGPCPTASAPVAREEAAFAFDSSDGYSVLFGGANSTVDELIDTWEFSGVTWTKLATTNLPDNRNGAALTFDASPGDRYLLLVGGSDGLYVPPDLLWGFVGGQWNELSPAARVGPGATEGGAMAYDEADGYVLYFGGLYPATGLYSSATWKFQAGTWTQLFPADAPFALAFASMSYDPDTGYVVLFGGSFYGSPQNDTWGYEGGSWFFLCGASSTCAYGTYAPSPRYGAGFAYDEASEGMVVFGGYGGVNGHSVLGDTWGFFPAAGRSGYWVNVTSLIGSAAPSPRVLPGMTWDVGDHEIVLFGGGNLSATFQDTWTMTDLYAGWVEDGSCGGPGQASCGSNAPNPAAAMVFTYDALDGEVVMSGGVGATAFSGYLQDTTWLFDAGTWYQCSTAECFAFFTGFGTYDGWGAAAYDAADGYTVTSGGESFFFNYVAGSGTYFWIPTSWTFGQNIASQGPGFSPVEVDLGQTVTFSVGAMGGGIGNYSFVWNGLPTGCVPPSAQAASFSCAVEYPGFTQSGGSTTYASYYDPSVEVFDSSGWPTYASPQSTSWLGWLEVAPDPVIYVNASATVADVGQTIYVGLLAYDGWQPFTFQWNGLPPGCTLVFSGSLPNNDRNEIEKCTLPPSAIGTWLTYASLTDSVGFGVAATPVPLTIYPAPGATAIAANTAALDAGQTLTLAISPSGGSGTYTYTWSGVPSSCLGDAAVLTCVVPSTEVGSYAPSVTVRDSEGATYSESYSGTIVVSLAPSATELTVTNASSDPTATLDAGQPATFTLVSTPGSGGDTVVWSGLPAGCLPATSDSTTVACSPAGVGTFDVSATVTDSNGEHAKSPAATLVVSPTLVGPTVDTSRTALDVGQSLELSATYSGGSGGTTFVWSSLPTGCLPADSATLACSPGAAGSWSPRVVVSDSNGATVSGTLTVPAAVFSPPTATGLAVTNSADQAVASITTGSSVTFTLTLTAGSGGDTIVWSGLPSGCTPAGADSSSVTCAPSVAGSYVVTAEVTDSNGGSATSEPGTLLVSSPAPAAAFATPSQELQIGLLGVAVALGAAALAVSLRRPRAPGGGPGSPPSGSRPDAPAGAQGATASKPDYMET
jgi:hypothetical protein